MPTLSVIIPVYNKQDYLDQTLSIFQSWKTNDAEFILVDDSSTDSSLSILNQYASADERMQVFSIPNEGVSNARNFGLKQASGEWIWFVDADDIPQLQFAEEFLTANHKEQIDIYIGNYVKVSDSNQEYITNPRSGFCSSIDLPQEFTLFQDKGGYYGYLWNKIIQKKLIDDSSTQFKVGLTLAEDMDFMISLYMHTKGVMFTPTLAMYYRVDAVNSSGEKKIDYLEQLKIQIKKLEWFELKKCAKKYAYYLQSSISYYAAFNVYYGYENKQNVDDIVHTLFSVSGVRENLISLRTSEKKGVMEKIAEYLYKGQIDQLKLYLKARTLLRQFYRIVRR